MNLSTTVKAIQDIMRKDDGIDGDAQRIAQLTWMLFLKVLDQQDELQERADPSYRPALPQHCRWRNWASRRLMTSPPNQHGLVSFVNETLFPTLRTLPSTHQPMGRVVTQVFEDLSNHMKSDALMVAVIEKLDQSIDLSDFRTRQNLGDIYEQVLNDLRSAGNAGEFYTPRSLTQLMVQLVDPQLRKNEHVLDPACGTGGFLTATIDHLRAQVVGKSDSEEKRIERLLHGIEKKQLPHLLCTTNLLLHGVSVPSQVEHSNTLARPWNSWESTSDVECVITNPPFGGLEESDAGADYPADLRTRETADLFLVLISRKLLAPGGRAAVVLPDGTLFGMGTKARIKEMLLEECNLHTIVRLPHGVFAPYTSIKTNLLFFTRGQPTTSIWFYEHPYPPGRRSYSKTRPLSLDEFEPLKAWWGSEDNQFADRRESDKAWRVDFVAEKSHALDQARPLWALAESRLEEATLLERDLRSNGTDAAAREVTSARLATLRAEARDAQSAGDGVYWRIYNLDRRNPSEPEQEIDDPDTLLARHTALLVEISEKQQELRAELAAALAHLSENDD